MDTKYVPSDREEKIYKDWVKEGYLKPIKGKPFTILMPPPNANASLHAGHGMYVIDDIMIRFKRLQGYASLWIPGTDHAGFETQYVFEKYLKKQGKSRMDFDRETLYKQIFNFVQENSGFIFDQFKYLGFLADWDRSVFTLDPSVIDYVYETFKIMVDDGLVYRDEYIVNYCTHCGTSLAELEVKYVERNDPLYYIKYGHFVLATVRPETKFGDTAIAVNPKDKRYKKWIGKTVDVTGLTGTFKLKVIADDFVDPKFGTGVVKITPGHDPNDFSAGRRHNLEIKKVIDLRGRLTDIAGPYSGLKVRQAREKVVADLEKKGLIHHIDEDYEHAVATCYRCGRDLEPLTIPNWFIKVDALKERVIKAVKANEVSFHPAKYKKQMLDWLDIMHDWPISRQIVWGIRIPAWECQNCNKWIITDGKKPKKCNQCLSVNLKQDEDTFDTWFSSCQWPLFSLDKGEYTTRFPTDFMGTLSDILKFWISRMILFSLYRRDQIPFKNVYLWSMVADAKGVKMSKSKGNVVDPMILIKKYGADAFRAGLIFGISQAGQVNLDENRIRAMRNFANKIWNIGRFIYINQNSNFQTPNSKQTHSSRNSVLHVSAESAGLRGKQARVTIHSLEKEFVPLKKQIIKNMELYNFSSAFDDLYDFLWHRFADYYIEELKEEVSSGNIEFLAGLEKVYWQILVLLHPFMPFVTEAVYKEFNPGKKSILDEKINL